MAGGRSKIKTKSILYVLTLIITGYLINNLSKINTNLSDFETVFWLITFLPITFSIGVTRQIVMPLINFSVMKKRSPYFYILVCLIVPYMILMLSVQYEILLDKGLIFYYSNGLIEGKTSIGLFNAVLLTPIWEELFFRGVLLFTLLKFIKPIWAI